MGVYLAEGYSTTLVNVNVDPVAFASLGCTKTPEAFFRDLVDRGDVIEGAVFELGSQPADGGLVQLNLRFSNGADVSRARAGLVADWLDCSTKIFDLLPQSAGSAPTGATYLRLMLGARGAFGTATAVCSASLLV